VRESCEEIVNEADDKIMISIDVRSGL